MCEFEQLREPNDGIGHRGSGVLHPVLEDTAVLVVLLVLLALLALLVLLALVVPLVPLVLLVLLELRIPLALLVLLALLLLPTLPAILSTHLAPLSPGYPLTNVPSFYQQVLHFSMFLDSSGGGRTPIGPGRTPRDPPPVESRNVKK